MPKCQCKTKKGTRCKRNVAKGNTKYCKQHSNCSNPVGSPSRTSPKKPSPSRRTSPSRTGGLPYYDGSTTVAEFKKLCKKAGAVYDAGVDGRCRPAKRRGTNTGGRKTSPKKSNRRSYLVFSEKHLSEMIRSEVSALVDEKYTINANAVKWLAKKMDKVAADIYSEMASGKSAEEAIAAVMPPILAQNVIVQIELGGFTPTPVILERVVGVLIQYVVKLAHAEAWSKGKKNISKVNIFDAVIDSPGLKQLLS